MKLTSPSEQSETDSVRHDHPLRIPLRAAGRRAVMTSGQLLESLKLKQENYRLKAANHAMVAQHSLLAQPAYDGLEDNSQWSSCFRSNDSMLMADDDDYFTPICNSNAKAFAALSPPGGQATTGTQHLLHMPGASSNPMREFNFS